MNISTKFDIGDKCFDFAGTEGKVQEINITVGTIDGILDGIEYRVFWSEFNDITREDEDDLFTEGEYEARRDHVYEMRMPRVGDTPLPEVPR